MQLKFFHDVTCIIFIIEVLLLSPFINNFFGIILTYSTNHDILYHKSHWTCRLIANLLQKWLVITVRPTTSVRKNPRKKLPPRNTPDSFCRRFTRQNHRCAAWAVFFFFREDCTLKISWADRTWYRLFVNAAAKQGQELRSVWTVTHIHEQHNLYLFLRLNNSETFVESWFWAQR